MQIILRNIYFLCLTLTLFATNCHCALSLTAIECFLAQDTRPHTPNTTSGIQSIFIQLTNDPEEDDSDDTQPTKRVRRTTKRPKRLVHSPNPTLPVSPNNHQTVCARPTIPTTKLENITLDTFATLAINATKNTFKCPACRCHFKIRWVGDHFKKAHGLNFSAIAAHYPHVFLFNKIYNSIKSLPSESYCKMSGHFQCTACEEIHKNSNRLASHINTEHRTPQEVLDSYNQLQRESGE